MTIIVSGIDLLQKRVKPLVELRAKANTGRAVIPGKLLRELAGYRYTVFTFILGNRKETTIVRSLNSQERLWLRQYLSIIPTFSFSEHAKSTKSASYCRIGMVGVKTYTQVLTDARTIGMGSSLASVRDVRGFPLNPASLLGIKDWDLSTTTYTPTIGEGKGFVFQRI